MKDVIVIGGGIIGSTVAESMRKQGRDVLLLDDGRPMGGTFPSGGHLKPSWFGDMKKADYEPAMELLNETWGLLEEDFKIRPTGIATKVFRVDTDQVLKTEKTNATVQDINTDSEYPRVVWHMGDEKCKLLVVAAGAWCDEFFPWLKITNKRGVSFRFKGKLQDPFIKPWAPYKQVVAHQQTEETIWIGDGSAILEKNWTGKRTNECLARCKNALRGLTTGLDTIRTGLRPYCASENGEPCLLKKVGSRTWVATGAGKSGTIAAGWVGRRLLDAST